MPLYICCTPIGNLKDITLRTLETLKKADYVACEDSRVSQKLLQHYNIKKSFIIYNDHNAARSRKKILIWLRNNENVVLISDAGMPLISDPGYKLVTACLEENLEIIVEPGPSSVLTALVLSGFPPLPFYFGGFFDKKKFVNFSSIQATLIFMESPHRLLATLLYLKNKYPDRKVVIIREMTKINEEVKRGFPGLLFEYYVKQPPKGEIMLIFDKFEKVDNSEEEINNMIKESLLKGVSLNETSKKISDQIGISKKVIYKKGLEIKRCL